MFMDRRPWGRTMLTLTGSPVNKVLLVFIIIQSGEDAITTPFSCRHP